MLPDVSYDDDDGKNSKEDVEPLRNFTTQQLRYFDGKIDDSPKGPTAGQVKPVYLSVNGIVFDVSEGRNFYGPDGPYEKFAGRECGVAFAKMSFDEQHLDDLEGCSTKLNFGERTELEGWIDKFTHYRNYPVKGKLVPDTAMIHGPDTVWKPVDLAKYNGTQSSSADDLPKGYATAPIYIGAGDKVFDVSFGGVAFYGPGGPYSKFAGRDASRALAKVSLEDGDITSNDVSDLTEKQIKVLNDWITTFEEKKKYPIVGRLQK